MNQGLKFTARAMDGAAAAGHLDMVVWLHEHGGACTTDAMDLAARGGYLDIVQVGYLVCRYCMGPLFSLTFFLNYWRH